MVDLVKGVAPVNNNRTAGALPALPDLQRMVAEAGRWDLISTAAWFKFDNDVARYRVAQVKRLRDEGARNADRFRPIRNRGGARR